MKSSVIKVYVTEEQKELLKSYAEANDTKPSEFLRVLGLEKIKELGHSTICEIEKEDLPEEVLTGSVDFRMSLTSDINKKLEEMAEKLGTTKQGVIRRLIREGTIVDMKFVFDMDYYLEELRNEVHHLNQMMHGIWLSATKSTSFTPHERNHIKEVSDSINEKSHQLLVELKILRRETRAQIYKKYDKFLKKKLPELAAIKWW